MIYVDDTEIKIGGKLLPGVFKSMQIDGDAKVEEQDVQGSTVKPKQAVGYEDAKITIEIQLDDDSEEKEARQTIFQKLAVIQSLFKQTDQEKPIVHEIVNQHTATRGVKQVIIKKLGTKEVNNKSTIIVTIELWEYIHMKITAKKSTGGAVASPAPSNLSQEYKDYLGADRGAAPGYSDKTAASPAVDNAAVTTNKLDTTPYGRW